MMAPLDCQLRPTSGGRVLLEIWQDGRCTAAMIGAPIEAAAVNFAARIAAENSGARPVVLSCTWRSCRRGAEALQGTLARMLRDYTGGAV